MVSPELIDTITKQNIAIAAIIALVMCLGVMGSFLYLAIKLVDKFAAPLVQSFRDLQSTLEAYRKTTEDQNSLNSARIATERAQTDSINTMSHSIEILSANLDVLRHSFPDLLPLLEHLDKITEQIQQAERKILSAIKDTYK